MNARKVLIVFAMFGLFSGSMAAEETYQVVKIWPEAPQGWHFYQPQAVAVDNSDNVYIGDSGNYRVKKFNPEGRLITQWGRPGPGNGQFNKIKSVIVGRSGIVYVLDEDTSKGIHSRIQKFTPYGQFTGTIERKATETDKANLSVAMTVDDSGNFFVLAVDFGQEMYPIQRATIEKYSPDGEFIAQWETDSGNKDGQLQIPAEIAVDAKNNVYIVDTGNDCVKMFDPSGKFLMKLGTGPSSLPRRIGFDKVGDIYVLDNYGVQKFTQEGKFLAKWQVKGFPNGIALDSHSNVYVVCMRAHAVLKFDNSGNLISGWGSAHTGDGQFMTPGSIATEPSGNVVVVDGDHIRKFTSDGRFVSKWGGYTRPMVMDLATDMSGNLYVACGDANEVQKYDRDGKLTCRWGSSGSGDGQFWFPSAIVVGTSGDVYVVDTYNNRVQKFTNDGKFLAKWGTEGTEDGQFDDPFFITTDDLGNVWVGDQLGDGKHRMQKFDANGKFLMNWTKKITQPRWTNFVGAVTVDSFGNSYYAFESRIEKYDSKGELVSTYGQEEFTTDKLKRVYDMCVDREGCVDVSGPLDAHNLSLGAGGSIKKYDADGKLANKWTAEDTEGLPSGPINVDNNGNIYVSYLASTPIWKLSPDGKPVAKFRIAASREGRFSKLGGVTVDSSGKVYAVDSHDVDWNWGIPSIQKSDLSGQLITLWDVPETSENKFKYPAFIAVDSSGSAYVTDHSSHCVHKLDAQGKYIKSWGGKGTGDGQFDIPEGITVDKSGNVLVCDRQNSRIQRFDSDGRFLTKWGKEGSGEGEFHFPAAVAVDKDGNVFVADSDNHRVQKFTAEGKFLTEWGQFGEAPGQFNVPLGIAVDVAGNVYVSDSHNHRIQKFAPVQSP